MKIFFLKKYNIPVRVRRNYYLLYETLKPLIEKEATVLHLGHFDKKLYEYHKDPKVFIDRKKRKGIKYNYIVAIDSQEDPIELLEYLNPGGQILFVEAAVVHKNWKKSILQNLWITAFAEYSVHPVAIHWWLIHFRAHV